MGSWNPEPFGNDTALDWVAGLETSRETAYLEKTMKKIVDIPDPLPAPECEEAIGAAAVIAAATLKSITQVPEETKTWILELGYVPSKDLIGSALIVVERIVANSELRELWQESASIEPWLRETNKVIERLRRATHAALPQREVKAPSMPRLLHRMVAMQAKAPDERLRQRIRTRLLALKDVNAPSKETNFEAPLCMLARTPLVEEARMLIERGANLKGPALGNPLVIACGAGQAQMAKMLLDAGAELFETIMIDANTGQTMDIVLDRKKAKPVEFRFAQALYAAARSGTPETVDLLLARGADLNQLDLNGETLLHKASEAGNTATLRHLIHLGLDVNQAQPDSSESPLHYAVRAGQLDAARVLLESGANPNLLAPYGDGTALDIAEDESTPMSQLIRSFGGLFATEIEGGKHKA